MESVLLIMRSVTQAQRLERALAQAGLQVTIVRTPMGLTDGKGCSYAVRTPREALAEVVNVIRGTGLRPVKLYVSGPAGYQEVAL